MFAFHRVVPSAYQRLVHRSMTCELPVIPTGHQGSVTNYSVGAGKQGFQSPIQPDSLIVDGIESALGVAHAERGLAYYEVVQSGHMIPQFSPWVRRSCRLPDRGVLTQRIIDGHPLDAVPYGQEEEPVKMTFI